MKLIPRAIIFLVVAFLELQNVSSAQTDDTQSEEYYNLVVEMKTLQRQSAINWLGALYQQRDDINQIIREYDQSIPDLVDRSRDAEQNVQEARSHYAAAQFALENDGVSLSTLFARQLSAQYTIETQPSIISSIQQAIDADDGNIGDLVQQWMYWDPLDATGLAVIEAAITQILTEEGKLYEQQAAAQSRYDQAQDDYSIASAQLPTAQNQVYLDEIQVNSTRSDLMSATTTLSADNQALNEARTTDEGQKTLLGNVNNFIGAQETVRDGQDTWLNNNSTYSIWIGNGRPE